MHSISLLISLLDEAFSGAPSGAPFLTDEKVADSKWIPDGNLPQLADIGMSSLPVTDISLQLSLDPQFGRLLPSHRTSRETTVRETTEERT